MRPNRVDVGLFGSSQVHCEHWNVVFRDEWSLMPHPGSVSGPLTPRRSVELCCGETDARASAPSCFTIKPSRRIITISISAEQTIRDLCTRHDVKYTKETPLPPGCTPSKLEGAHDPAYVKPMQQITGSVSYLATTVRCDIGHAASTLGQVSHNPNDKQLAAAKHTLRYLNGTADLGLQWSIQKEPTRNRVECWVDASFADNKGFKSQTGYIFMLNGAPVSWASKTQRFVSTSSTEAEIVAACDAVKECAFIKALLNSWNSEEWPCAVTEPIVCLEDNESCINWFDNGLISSRAKHYGTRMYYIRDQIKKTRLVTFTHVNTKDQRADALTKSLAKAHQRRHTDKIMQQIYKNHINSTMSVCQWTIPG
eukprot:m.392250 g.392250  ORF g.392250 m.392250 type:complete len:367 (+) comp16762_c0_seq36:407-1507(+)